MELDLDASSPLPLYVQIVERIGRLIALGALRAGDRLPTVRELAIMGRVNRNTAARAVRELEREGVVRTRVGQGTFVVGADRRQPSDASVRARALEETLDRLLVEAYTLGIPLEELGWRLSRRIDEFNRRRRSAGAGEEMP